MNSILLRSGVLLALGLFLQVGVWAQTPPRLPLEMFFAEEDCSAMQLAPDGKHLAFLTTLGFGKVGVALMDLTTGKYEPLVSAHDENIKVFFWKGSDYIVYAGDVGSEDGGVEIRAWRAIPIVPSKPGKLRRVVALSKVNIESLNEVADIMMIVDPLVFDPLHLLGLGRRLSFSKTTTGMLGVNECPDMYFVDVSDSRRTVARNYLPVSPDAYIAQTDTCDIADNHGDLRARTRVEGNRRIIEVRHDPMSHYAQVAEFPCDRPGWKLLFFAADNENLYLYNRDKGDTRSLHTFNLRTRQLSAPIFRAPEGEIDGVLTSWDRSTLYGVSCDAEKPHYHFFDAGRAKLQQIIDASLPGTFNRIVSSSQDEQILLILASSDRDPGTYYVLDRAHGRMGPVGKVRASVNPEQMQPMEPVSFTARDGLVIHGYLTRPAGAAGHGVPLIIHPHGGPYGIRDNWGFDPEVQFLANRGYAVLQVNFRGSGGYGESFERAGYKEWGGKMQDDLTDAVKWAISEGIADPARVAIYGTSFGGYAALAGLVLTPELYCCGANYVGPSDLGLLARLGRNRSDSSKMFYTDTMGDDKKYLQTRSPLNFIERLRAPLFNAYGYNDPRVDFRHWTRLEAQLKKYNKPYEIVIEDNEGHGFSNEKNRIVYYKRLEAFFDRYLAVAVVSASQPSPKLSESSSKSAN